MRIQPFYSLMTDYSEFEKALGYEFKDKALLEEAFTHTTYVFERGKGHWESNQRLEFIGDSVIDLVVGCELYAMKPEEGEGYLSKTRAVVVCERSFAEAARKLNMGQYLLLGKGEELTGGKDKDSTLADCFEAVMAAVFYDGGYEAAKPVILKNLSETIQKAARGEILLDYKSRLLELAQVKGRQHNIRFSVTDERGPAHAREFDVEVYADDTFLAKATGRSKRDAEQKCAEEAIGTYLKIFPEK